MRTEAGRPSGCSSRIRLHWDGDGSGIRWFAYIQALFLFLLAVTPLAASEAKAPDGALLYRRYCASCHGESGAGDGPDALFFESPPRDLRSGFLDKYPASDLVQRIRDGRALQLALDLPALRARATEVESIVAYMRRVPSIKWDRVEPGWNLYADRCETCHGTYGHPTRELPAGMRAPRDLSTPEFQKSSDAELKLTVRHGHHYMPALVPRLTEQETTEIASFVRLLSPGFELYTRHCAACHGDDGRGVGSFGEAIQLPTTVFDRSYFSRRDPEEIRDGVWHMVAEHKPAMPHFRWILTEAQTRAIVEFLKRTEPKLTGGHPAPPPDASKP